MSPSNNKSKSISKKKDGFSAQAFLDSAGVARKVRQYKEAEIIFSQGKPAESVFYIQEGSVKITVVNEIGKEAVIAILGPEDFFGEGCLADQPICMGNVRHPSPKKSSGPKMRSEEHTSELQSPYDILCRPLREKKKQSLPRFARCHGQR